MSHSAPGKFATVSMIAVLAVVVLAVLDPDQEVIGPVSQKKWVARYGDPKTRRV